MKILVVEDDVLLALCICDTLIEAGHEVLGPARTYHEALHLAQSAGPELVLSNINLADGSKGTDLARTLCADFEMPVLFISGNVHEARAAEHVALGFIAKPCSAALLLRSVEVAQALIGGSPPASHHVPEGLLLFRDTLS
jgi:DNA-binding response OmpR family regulator